MRNLRTNFKGLILIEIIVSIILLGIIGVFTSMFLYTGINAYMLSRQTSEGAMRAQIALDRINLELRRVNGIPPGLWPVVNTSFTYTCDDLPGVRKLVYTAPDNPPDNDNGYIALDVDGNQNTLINDLTSFTLSVDTADLNNSGDTVEEISGINIGFTIKDVGKPFNLRIYPRSENWLPAPP